MAEKNKSGIEHLERKHINWFPGHMNKAVLDIKKKIKAVDIVIEVRDARAPLASGNKSNIESGTSKPYLVVLNKTNLTTPEVVSEWQQWFTKEEEHFLFINALDKNSLKSITELARSIVHKNRLKSNDAIEKKMKVKIMVVGLPNTGKSTLINKLADRNATKAAATPGQTKMSLWVNVDEDTHILDTPGVMPPRLNQKVHALWLSAIHAIADHVVSPEDTACFLVNHFLQLKAQAFKDQYKFDSLDIDLVTACNHIGKVRGCLQKGGEYNYDKIYKIILQDFRKGVLGPTHFERPPS
jgi:ribosome biogenesis GTPase A